MWCVPPGAAAAARCHPATDAPDGLTAPALFDYVAVGHVTVDVLPNGARRPGGTVLYGALQAARLGARALVFTRGAPEEVRTLLAPFADELELHVQPAPATTTFETAGLGTERRQRLLAWAGRIDAERIPPAAVVHLGPVADELREAPRGRHELLGLTPQGLARRWDGPGATVHPRRPAAAAEQLAAACDALVLSEQELVDCAALVERALEAGATVAITAGGAPSRLLLPGGEQLELEVEPLLEPVDDLGAGDVYAATFFLELAAGAPAERAGQLANAAAALRIRAAGPAAVAGRAAIEAHLAELHRAR